jgi:hypothetical protein
VPAFGPSSEPAVAAPSRAAAAGLESIREETQRQVEGRMILAADIGAATSHLALFDSDDGRLLRVETYSTRAHSVAELVARFLRTVPNARVDSACIGLHTSSPVYAHELAEVFDIPAVVVVDGLEAHVLRLHDLAGIAAERFVHLGSAIKRNRQSHRCEPRRGSPEWTSTG